MNLATADNPGGAIWVRSKVSGRMPVHDLALAAQQYRGALSRLGSDREPEVFVLVVCVLAV